MYTIGEFARFGSVSVRMLRHYDEIGLLHPARVDPVTSYRSYSAGQLPALNRIVALKELGFNLAEVADLLGEVTAEELHGMLSLRRSQVRHDLAEHEARLQRIEARLRHIEKEGHMPIHEIVLKSLPAVRIAAVPRPAEAFGPDHLVPVLRSAFDELATATKASGVAVTGLPFACHTGDPDAGTLVTFASFPVSGDTTAVVGPAALYDLAAVPEAAVLTWRGPLDEAHSDIYQTLPRWIEEHGFEAVGAGRDVFVDVSPEDPDEGVVEVQWPLRRPGGDAPDVEPQPVS